MMKINRRDLKLSSKKGEITDEDGELNPQLSIQFI